MNLLIVFLVAVGCWTVSAFVTWAFIHAGARSDLPEWDE